MERKELSKIRGHLGKTQKQLAQLLGIPIKTLQSFEQGWRKIPVHIERQVLLLLAMKSNPAEEKARSCWEIKKCREEIRGRCPAWEFQYGHFCWFINGTICQGNVQKSWSEKMEMCRQCEVFGFVVPCL